MRYPYNNFPQDFSLTAGYQYGDKTSYGYHDGQDVNNKGGGNSDLGIPIYAIADGVVTSVHYHTTKPTFGRHLHYLIKGPWGERYIHHAHLLEIFVQEGESIKEGKLIAKIGNSGTDWAHDHWAIKKQPTGVDGIATSLERLSLWEDPLTFTQKWINVKVEDMPTYLKTLFQELGINPETEEGKVRELFGRAKDFYGLKENLENSQKATDLLQIQISDLRKQVDRLTKQLSEATSPKIDPETADLSIADLLIMLVKKITPFLPK